MHRGFGGDEKNMSLVLLFSFCNCDKKMKRQGPKATEGRKDLFQFQFQEVRKKALTASYTISTVKSLEKQMHLSSPSLLQDFRWIGSSHINQVVTIPYRRAPRPIWSRQSLCLDPLSGDSKLCGGDSQQQPKPCRDSDSSCAILWIKR